MIFYSLVILFFVYALSSAKLVLSKVALAYCHPIFFVALHNGIAGLVFLTYYYFLHKTIKIHNRLHATLFLKAILFGVYIPYILRFWGLQFMPAYKASLLLSFAPFISYIMSYMMRQETWSWIKIVGLCISFFGMMPIFILQAQKEASLAEFWIFSTAELAEIVSTIALIYGWISIKELTKNYHYDSSCINGIVMTCGGLLALGTSYLKESMVIGKEHIMSLILILAFITFVGNIFVHTMYVRLLKQFNVTMLAFAKLLSPLFTAFYGWLFLHDIITWHFFAAFIGLTIGMIIFYHQEIRSLSQSPT